MNQTKDNSNSSPPSPTTFLGSLVTRSSFSPLNQAQPLPLAFDYGPIVEPGAAQAVGYHRSGRNSTDNVGAVCRGDVAVVNQKTGVLNDNRGLSFMDGRQGGHGGAGPLF